MGSPYIIRVSSQKGGVGKTTIAVNLGAVLSLLNYRVLLVDADAANPSVGIHLGLEQANMGFKDVVTGKANMSEAIIVHAPTGMRILPGTISAYSYIPKKDDLTKFLKAISTSNYDFIIIDTSPGIATEEPIEFYQEALLITTPEATSCTSTIRLAHMYTQNNLKHNLVINKIRNKRYEYSVSEIEDMYENRAIAAIHEDETVPVSVSDHIPAYLLNPRSEFSKNIKVLSRKFSTKLGSLQMENDTRYGRGGGLIGFIRRLLFGR